VVGKKHVIGEQENIKRRVVALSMNCSIYDSVFGAASQ
jgi:hypothetical protein